MLQEHYAAMTGMLGRPGDDEIGAGAQRTCPGVRRKDTGAMRGNDGGA